MSRLSASAVTKVTEELSHLTTVRRLELSEALAEARSAGNMQDNPDYFVVRAEQDLLERRIVALQAQLQAHESADPAGSCDPDVVAAGSTVEVQFDGDDDVEVLLVGSTVEASVQGLEVCSPASPLGQALLGARAGAQVSFRTPAGATMKVTLQSVRPAA